MVAVRAKLIWCWRMSFGMPTCRPGSLPYVKPQICVHAEKLIKALGQSGEPGK